jgi:hypothetical protein
MAFYTSKNLILELHKLPEKRVLLHFAIKKNLMPSFSSYAKSKVHCFVLLFHCIFYCISIAYSLLLCVRFELNKLCKKRVLLYLIMDKFCNLLKFNMFEKSKSRDSINNPLLIHYYFHYYSLLFSLLFIIIFYGSSEENRNDIYPDKTILF